MKKPYQVLKKKRHKRGLFQGIGFVLAFVLSFLALDQQSLFFAITEPMTDIRVGLSAHQGEEEILIKTNRIGLGYCIQDEYFIETEFFSELGFIFSPAKESYYRLNQTFSSYEEAKRAAESLLSLGTDAYPVALYRSEWGVYTSSDAAFEGMGVSKVEGDSHKIKVQGSEVMFLYDGAAHSAYPQFKALEVNENNVAVLSLTDRSYRGRLEIGGYGKAELSVVNIVNIEVYLYGVVPSEMVPSWPLEALKAQAVCARSFALQKAGYKADSDIQKAYRMEDTVSSQVYKGYEAEKEETNRAVEETKGMVVFYKGDLISTYYYSTSGGRTENGEDVWGLTSSSYRSVPDLFETKPERAPWIVSHTASEIESRLLERGIDIGSLESIIPEITTESGRVYSLKLKGSAGNAVLQSDTIRSVLGLASTKFKVIESGTNPDLVSLLSASGNSEKSIQNCTIFSAFGEQIASSIPTEQYVVLSADNMTNFPKEAPADFGTYSFAGMGYGHGVGLSQSGARGMAEAGYTYEQIIAYYYSGATLQPALSFR